jgi:hypothetical protein
MTFSFFYFLGFVSTFLGASWKHTLVLNVALFFFFELVLSNGFVVMPVALLIGWASAVLIPSHFLFVQAEVFAMNASNHMNLVVYTLELLLFAMLCAATYTFDNSPYLWMIMMLLHIVYVVSLMEVAKRFNFIERKSQSKVGYFAMFATGLVAADFVYLLASGVFGHGSTLVSTSIAAAAATAVCYLVNLVHTYSEIHHDTIV